jgi:2-keto-4-pentenoate hydratase/2-oxohepta-3-ene-1,7-dioic acid hydratase in catechol pathway
MKLASIRQDDAVRVVAVVDDEIVDIATVAPQLPRSMVRLLEAGPSALAEVRRAIDSGSGRRSLKGVTFAPPIARPPKFLAIGLNYPEHVAETGGSRPEFPMFFNKQSTCVIGPGDPIHRPRVSTLLDYEGELGVVIGRRCRHVPRERAHEVIAGYVVVNDVTVRDWQMKAPTMTIGKSFDTHGPIGPWLVTADELRDPHTLRLRTWVNDELRQDANTSEMLFDCFEQIATLTTAFTLEPGDVIATGTPSGVGVMQGKFLVPGDVVRIEIEGIGTLSNPVIEEPSSTATL